MPALPVPYRQPLLFQPVESLTGYSFHAVVDEVRAVWFPELEDEFEVRFGANGPLAFIALDRMGPGRHIIVFHPILNRPGTPIEVVRFIAKHELAHAARPPRVADGTVLDHPPEFWALEIVVAPERYAAWTWAFHNLRGCLVETDRGLRVVHTWRRRLESRPPGPYTPHLPFNDLPWRVLCPQGGAQLRLPPTWAWRPTAASRRHPPAVTQAPPRATLKNDAPLA